MTFLSVINRDTMETSSDEDVSPLSSAEPEGSQENCAKNTEGKKRKRDFNYGAPRPLLNDGSISNGMPLKSTVETRIKQFPGEFEKLGDQGRMGNSKLFRG